MVFGNKTQNQPAVPPPPTLPPIPPALVPAIDHTKTDPKFVINAAGLALVKYYEGRFLKSYRDSVGVWTIGYGRILHDDGSHVGSGETCTEEQCTRWLMEDLEKDGAHYVRAWRPNLNENQFSALTSFAFNRGAGRLRELLAMPGPVDANMLHFDFAGRPDNHLLGLQRRRRSEAALYRGEDWTSAQGWHS